MQRSYLCLVSALVMLGAIYPVGMASAQDEDWSGFPTSEWPLAGGHFGQTRHSALTQITPENIDQLGGAWVTDHGRIWDEIVWNTPDGTPAPELGWQAIASLAETHTMGYYLPSGPIWMDDPTGFLEYDMADCWASCMIPFNWGL